MTNWARQNFVASLRIHVGTITSASKLVYERKVKLAFVQLHNRPPRDHHEVRRSMKREATYQAAVDLRHGKGAAPSILLPPASYRRSVGPKLGNSRRDGAATHPVPSIYSIRRRIPSLSRWAPVADTDQAHDAGEPAVGRTARPRRTSQAWDRDQSGRCFQVHDPAPEAAVADLEDIPSEPCGLSGVRRFLRRADSHFSAPVRRLPTSRRPTSSLRTACRLIFAGHLP